MKWSIPGAASGSSKPTSCSAAAPPVTCLNSRIMALRKFVWSLADSVCHLYVLAKVILKDVG